MITLTEYENAVLNIVKAKFGLRNKSEAIRLMIQTYESEFLEPEFIEEMRAREKESIVRVDDFGKHFGLEENVV